MNTAETAQAQETRTEVATEQVQALISELQTTFAEIFGVTSSGIAPDATFLELGADSLTLLRAGEEIGDRFGVRIPFRRLMEDLDTVADLATFLAQNLPEDAASAVTQQDSDGDGDLAEPAAELPELPAPSAGSGAVSDDLRTIFREQLQLMTRQLEMLRQRGRGAGSAARKATAARGSAASAKARATAPAKSGKSVKSGPYVAYQPLGKKSENDLTEQQRQHLDGLMERLGRQLAGSREATEKYRTALANDRAVVGFRLLWKDLIHPLMAERGQGSKIWDVDGREYLDMAMGFGSLLLGHSPACLTTALKEQIDLGIQVGPESPIAGEAAELVGDLTGSERAAFTNSGTEAVMTSLRLARTVTGRSKIALFAGSYHGTFDGVLARGVRRPDGQLDTVPLAPGVPRHMIDEILLLDYESADSIALVEEHADELAAVLVEPRQSRRPDIETRAFLHDLRKVTADHGTALVFDEVVTGFRVHPGGIQALYDLRADITTYGKAAGNGLPIGIVAGRSEYLDAIDGGQWRYGDNSLPEADTTFASGTFFRNPLVMAGVRGVLGHLKAEGPGLQETLGRRTTELAGALNGTFDRHGIPLQVLHFASIFAFAPTAEIRHLELFYYHLLERGIHTGPRRIGYLSPAHTEEDLERFRQAVEESALALRSGGFLPKASPAVPGVGPGAGGSGQSGADGGEFALTESQKEVWAIAQLGGEASAAYNLPLALRLSGELRPDLFRAALQRIVDRHAALRATIDPHGEWQRIQSRLDLLVPLIDLSALPAAVSETLAQNLWLTESGRSFDLATGPLVRFTLIRRAEDEHLFVLNAHHIAADGRSLGVVLAELGALYGASAAGEDPELPPPASYTAYLERRASQDLDAAESFWLERFAGPPPNLELPLDHPRPPFQTFVGDLRSRRLGASETGRLEEFARSQGSTPFMVLLAAVKVLLRRLSGQRDLVVGIPTAGRRSEENALIAYCVNVLPLRSRQNGEDSFADFLSRVKGVMLDAYQHEGYPYSRLIRTLGLRRDPSQPALLQAMFNLDRRSDPALPGLEVAVEPSIGRAAQVDIEWNVAREESELFFECFYNTALFEAATIDRWQGYLLRILEQAADEPSRPLATLELMGAAERQQILVDCNQTAIDFADAGLVQIFVDRAGRHPEVIAASHDGATLTYGQLERNSADLGTQLLENGVGAEDVVAVLSDRGLDLLTAILGILRAGGAYLPLDPHHPELRHREILGSSEARCLLVSAEWEEAGRAGADGSLPVLVLGEARDGEEAAELPLPAAGDRLAYMIYTSGSTGAPKGAMVTHGGMLNHLHAKVQDLGLTSQDVVAQTASQCFDISIWQFLAPIVVGGRVEIYGEELVYAPTRMVDRCVTDGVTVLELVPSLLASVLDGWEVGGDGAPELAELRWLMVTGEALPPDLCRRWLARQPQIPLVNAYGPTECSDDVTHAIIDQPPAPEAPRVPIGQAVANTRLYVIDRAFQPQPHGVPGQLAVAGAGVGRGYAGDPNRTAAVFVPDPFAPEDGGRLYLTGDLVIRRPHSELEFLGRLDHQIKVRGFRIELGEIEAALCGHPEVREAVVLLHKDGVGEGRLVAYLVGDGEADLATYLQQRLPSYMTPSAFVALEALPLNANGKVDRKALAQRAPAATAEGGDTTGPGTFVAPSTAAEQALAEIWCEVLKREQIGIHDNFFELGGDSILGIQVVTRARHRGFELSAVQIFQHPTIAELAAGADFQPPIPDDDGAGEVLLSPVQRWFAERSLAEPHHWNMSAMLAADRPLQPAPLATALAALRHHHEALRLCLPADGTSATATLAAAEDTAGSLVWIDHSALDTDRRAPERERVAATLQKCLAPGRGHLLTAAYFAPGDEPGRLLILVHHLAVDITSLQILAQDLNVAYLQAVEGRRPELAAVPTSLGAWTRRLTALAASPDLAAEADHWTGLPEKDTPMPVDFTELPDVEGSAAEVVLELDSKTSEALLAAASKQHRARMSEVVLAALAIACERWTGSRRLLVELEGHGREAPFEGVDLSRTVGWLTCGYPVSLEVAEDGDVAATLRSVKEAVRGVPRGGIGYGALRYLADDSEIRERLAAVPRPEVIFNYSGHQQAASEGLLTPVGEPCGAARGPANERPFLIEVDAGVADGRLRTTLRFSRRRHRRSTLETLAEHLRAALVPLAEDRTADSLTPADFPQARASRKDLSKLLGQLAGSTAR